jgi:hypothetical protein
MTLADVELMRMVITGTSAGFQDLTEADALAIARYLRPSRPARTTFGSGRDERRPEPARSTKGYTLLIAPWPIHDR